MKKIDTALFLAIFTLIWLLNLDKEVAKGLITGCVIGWIFGRKF